MLKKTDLTPLPSGADPTKWVDAVDWFPLQQSNQYNVSSPEFGGVNLPATGNSPSSWLTGTDLGAAIAAVQAAMPLTGGLNNQAAGTIDIPSGYYWLGQPIHLFTPVKLRGAGSQSTIIRTGQGDATNIANVPLFQGPQLYIGPQIPYKQGYGAPLVGATGQSLNVSFDGGPGNDPTYLLLHDSYVWNSLNGLAAFSLEMWVNLTDTAGPPRGIMSSSGFLINGTGSVGNKTTCFEINGQNGGGIGQIGTILTTSGTAQQASISPTFAYGTTHHVAIYYDGAHFTSFLDGVNFGNIAMTGTLSQQPWEGVTIGNSTGQGPEGYAAETSVTGRLDSIRLSNIARHTGTTTFSPPVAKYVWDSNTLALMNWDQGTGGTTHPWVIGQAANPNVGVGNNGNPTPHYIRSNLGSTGNIVDYIEVSGLSLISNTFNGINGCNSGIIVAGGAFSKLTDIQVISPAKFGISALSSGLSFYSSIKDCTVTNGSIGIYANFNVAKNLTCFNGSIPMIVVAGSIDTVNIQPGAQTIFAWACITNNSIFATADITNLNVDTESPFPLLQGGVLIDDSMFSITIRGSTIEAITGLALHRPAVILNGTPNVLVFDNVLFYVDAGSPELIHKNASIGISTINSLPIMRTCYNQFLSTIPWSLTPNFILLQGSAQATSGAVTGWQQNNIVSLSGTDSVGNNLRGTATVTGAATTATLTFTNAEPDTNYFVTATAVSSTGGPAAGSNRVLSVTKNVGSVVLTVEAAPGGAATVTFNIMIMR